VKISKRRVGRVRDELRQWLRSHHGLRTSYSKNEIDRGREDLGFGGIDDALVAYTLFGGDLMPGIADSLGLSVTAEQISEIIDAVSEGVVDTTELLAGE